MAYNLSINLSMIAQEDADPIETLATFQLLGSTHPNGHVTAPARTVALVIKRDVAHETLKIAKYFISSICSVDKIKCANLHDLPVEFDMYTTPEGIYYKIQMGSLDQIITWHTANQELTLDMAQTYEISLEAYIYFIQTFEDLLTKIDLLP